MDIASRLHESDFSDAPDDHPSKFRWPFSLEFRADCISEIARVSSDVALAIPSELQTIDTQ
jgi:hypothetical protein